MTRRHRQPVSPEAERSECRWLFFFRAEGGIRDGHVTGVQTCALPIWIRGIIGRIPDAAIVAFHSWRALAGFAFLACGHSGLLPAVFVRNAGYGDLAVAALIPFVLLLPETRQKYLWFHIAGLTDFVFAVGTGLYFTMRGNPLM